MFNELMADGKSPESSFQNLGRRRFLQRVAEATVGAALLGKLGLDALSHHETGENPADSPARIVILHEKEGYQNGVLVANNATVTRIDKDNDTVYLKVPGNFNKKTAQEDTGGNGTQTVDTYTGVEIGFKIDKDVAIHTWPPTSKYTGYGDVIGNGIDTFVSAVKVGDRLGAADAILSLTQSPGESSQMKQKVTENQEALKALDNRSNTTPIFSAYQIVANK